MVDSFRFSHELYFQYIESCRPQVVLPEVPASHGIVGCGKFENDGGCRGLLPANFCDTKDCGGETYTAKAFVSRVFILFL